MIINEKHPTLIKKKKLLAFKLDTLILIKSKVEALKKCLYLFVFFGCA